MGNVDVVSTHRRQPVEIPLHVGRPYGTRPHEVVPVNIGIHPPLVDIGAAQMGALRPERPLVDFRLGGRSGA